MTYPKSPLSTVEGRYHHDNVFRAMVDGMMFAIESLQLTPSEVREAAMFAAIRIEGRRPLSFRVPQESPPCPHNAVIDTNPPRCTKCGRNPEDDATPPPLPVDESMTLAGSFALDYRRARRLAEASETEFLSEAVRRHRDRVVELEKALVPALRTISYNVIDEAISREGLRNVAENALASTGLAGAARADDENPAALVTVNDLLHIDGAFTSRGDEIKAWIRDLDNGGTHKAYLGADECERLANGFRDLAARLRLKG